MGRSNRSERKISLWAMILGGLAVLAWGSACHRVETGEARGVVAMSPALTEIVLELGAGDALLGTSPYTTDVRASGVRRIDSQGSLETIVSLKPSKVLMHPTERALSEKLEMLGISTLMLRVDTVPDVEASVMEAGRALGRGEEASRLVAGMRESMAANRAEFGKVSRGRALIIVDRLDARVQQFYIAQAPSYLAEVIAGCGFEVISTRGGSWVRIDAEKLIELGPEVIVYFVHDAGEKGEILQMFRKYYSSLGAVRGDRVLVYGNPSVLVPGPLLGRKQREVCEALLVEGKQ